MQRLKAELDGDMVDVLLYGSKARGGAKTLFYRSIASEGIWLLSYAERG